ncbi:MAG: hypothetical protein R3C58_00425 [Parvularculaceae bacterium]
MMKRRLFLKTTLSSLLAAPALAHGANKARVQTPDRVFYDERFGKAHALSTEFGAARTPVRGDVTAVWREELNALSRAQPLFLSGVTTESFYFCLTTLLQSHARVDARAERVSKDLYAWSIRTRFTGKTG